MVATQRRDDLTFVFHTIYLILYNALGIVNVEPSLIVLIGSMSGHGDIEVTKGLVGHSHVLAGSLGHHLVVGKVLCLFVLPLEDEASHLRQSLLGAGIHHLVGLTCPDGLFVQLDMFHGRRTEHHATYDTIAHRQCLRPRLGRAVVPESVTMGRHQQSILKCGHQKESLFHLYSDLSASSGSISILLSSSIERFRPKTSMKKS